MVQKVDAPLPQDRQMPHWFWQVYQRINNSIIDGTFTVQALFTAGTASAPGISFVGDTNTGIYSPGADQVGISTTGTSRVTVNSTGNFVINAPSSGRALEVVGGASGSAVGYFRGSFSGGNVDIAIENQNSGANSNARLILTTANGSWVVLADRTNGLYSLTSASSLTVYSVVNAGNHTFSAPSSGTTATVTINVLNGAAPLKLGTLTVANLPAAATAGAGSKGFVSDATATTFATVVAGGGSNIVPVYSDGTNWRIG